MKVDLRTARHFAKMSQQKAASSIGVSIPTLSRWELGIREPKVTKFLALCDLYGVKPSDVILPEK